MQEQQIGTLFLDIDGEMFLEPVECFTPSGCSGCVSSGFQYEVTAVFAPMESIVQASRTATLAFVSTKDSLHQGVRDRAGFDTDRNIEDG